MYNESNCDVTIKGLRNTIRRQSLRSSAMVVCVREIIVIVLSLTPDDCSLHEYDQTYPGTLITSQESLSVDMPGYLICRGRVA